MAGRIEEVSLPFYSMRATRFAALVAACCLAGCQTSSAPPQGADDFGSLEITLPGHQTIRVEPLSKNYDRDRGLKFRSSLAPDRGALFVYPRPGSYPLGMFQVQIPLDIVWLDSGHFIVEMVKNAQPCPGATAAECPVFVGRQLAQFILEMPSGSINRYQLQAGQKLEW
jgi:uncharacterized membrane protein (UPF0127 family)